MRFLETALVVDSLNRESYETLRLTIHSGSGSGNCTVVPETVSETIDY